MKPLSLFTAIVLFQACSPAPTNGQYVTTLKANSDAMTTRANGTAVSSTGDFFVACSKGNHAVQIGKDGNLIKRFPIGNADASLFAMDMAQDRFVVLSRSYKKWVTFCDLEKETFTHRKYQSKQFDLDINSKLGLCYAVGNSSQIKLLTMPEGESKGFIATRYSNIHALDFTPRFDALALGGYDEKAKVSTIEIRDGSGKDTLQTLGQINDFCSSIEFSESGEIVAAGGYSGAIKIWSRRKRKILHQRDPVTDGPDILDFEIQDDRWVWIASNIGAVQLLDLNTGRVTVPNPKMGNAHSISMLADNLMLVGGNGNDGIAALSIWSISEGKASPPRPMIAVSPLNPETNHDGQLPNPPSAAAQAKARKTVMEVLGLAADARISAFKAEGIAKTLMKAAVDEADLANRYVSLVESIRFSTMAGNSNLAKHALATIDKQWNVDSTAQAIATLRSSADASIPSDKRSPWADWAAELMREFESESNYVAAVSAANIAADLMTKARDGSGVIKMRAKITQLSKLANRQQSILKLTAALRGNPADPKANFQYGILLCTSGDWKLGLEHLANSDRPGFGLAIAAEVKSKGSPKDQLGFARQWAALAQAESDPTTRAVATASAAFWFDSAIKNLSGLTKLSAQKDRQQLGELSLQRK